MRDPRSHRRYVTAATAYKAANLGAPCALCGQPVWTRPTVEHRLAVRHIQAIARDYAHAVELACDQSMWAMAHSRCQSQQGARAVNATRKPSTSRW